MTSQKLFSVLIAALAIQVEGQSISPPERIFEQLQELQIQLQRSNTAGIGDRNMVTVTASRFDPGDLQLPGLTVTAVDPTDPIQLPNQKFNGGELSSPCDSSRFSGKQPAIYLFAVRLNRANYFIENFIESTIRKCAKEMQVVPIGTRSIVALARSTDLLPRWVDPQHLIAASLSLMPCPVERFRDPKPQVLNTWCEPILPPPAAESLPSRLENLGPGDCVSRDGDSVLRLGVLRTTYQEVPFELKAHSSSPKSGEARPFYFQCEPPRANEISNWATLDLGMKKAPITISLMSDQLDVKDSKGQTRPDQFAGFLCNALSERLREEEQLTTFLRSHHFYRTQCHWRRETRFEGLASYKKHGVDEGLIFIPTSEYIRLVSEAPIAPRLVPVLKLPEGISKWDNLEWYQKAAKSALETPFGELVIAVFRTDALEHPGVRHYFEIIANGPLKHGYKGPIAYFSDIDSLRYNRR